MSAVSRKRGRPPAASGDRRPTRDELVQAGVALLCEKSFSATGIGTMLGAVNVSKGSFYNFFDSKEEFGLALIDAYARYFEAKLDRHFANESLPPLGRLHAFTADATAGMAKHGYRRGCLVGNLGQEMGSLPESFRVRLIKVLEDWQAKTAACLTKARERGEVAGSLDCTRAAEFFWIGWEGAVLRAKLERRRRPLDVYCRSFFDSLAVRR